MNGITVHSWHGCSLCPPPGIAPTDRRGQPPVPAAESGRPGRKILTALILAENIDGFIADAPPGWHVHRLSGDRQAEWSVSVSGNWRITFKEEDSYIDRLNLEDYH